MNLPLITAELDLTTLIYMIAVVLWVFGNLFSQKNKKKQQEQRRARPETPAERELREFLERMSGQTAGEEEEEIEAPPAVVEPPRRRPEPARTMQVPVTPSPRMAAPKVSTLMSSLPHQVADLERSESAAMGQAFSSALKSTGSQFRLTESNISILKQAMKSSLQPPDQPVLTRKDLKDKQMFRKVMAARVILGRPKAFETYDVPEAIRH